MSAPINTQGYVSAYSGALAGMAVSGWITDSDSADYALVTAIAGAFASAFDSTWNSAVALNNLEIQTIQSVCQQEFSRRSPAPFAAAQYAESSTWIQAAAGCVALVKAADTYFTGQGIIPPTPSAANPFGPQHIFTINGTFTVPTGITGALFEGCGGGGGGGGGAGYTNADSAGGGGGGGAPRASKSLALTPGDVITVTIGAGGNGGTAGAAGTDGINGTVGGDTIISSAAHGEIGRFRGASGGMAAKNGSAGTAMSAGGTSVTNSNGNGNTNYQVFDFIGTTPPAVATNNGSIGNDATGEWYGTYGSPGAGGASGSGYAGFPGCDSATGAGGAGGAKNSSSGGGGGGGGGYGAGAAGGASGLNGSPGTAPVAGSAAAANTGGGGGGGGAGSTTTGSAATAGAAGGNGGSGYCVVSW